MTLLGIRHPENLVRTAYLAAFLPMQAALLNRATTIGLKRASKPTQRSI
jgi:hypothetical protein